MPWIRASAHVITAVTVVVPQKGVHFGSDAQLPEQPELVWQLPEQPELVWQFLEAP